MLGGDEDEREARRLFRNELAQGHVSDNVASSSRIVRRGYGRNSALSRTPNALSTPTPDIMHARRVQFPARMGLESVSSSSSLDILSFQTSYSSSACSSFEVPLSMLVHPIDYYYYYYYFSLFSENGVFGCSGDGLRAVSCRTPACTC